MDKERMNRIIEQDRSDYHDKMLKYPLFTDEDINLFKARLERLTCEFQELRAFIATRVPPKDFGQLARVSQSKSIRIQQSLFDEFKERDHGNIEYTQIEIMSNTYDRMLQKVHELQDIKIHDVFLT